MWSKSNTVSMLYVAVGTILVCLFASHLLPRMTGIPSDFADIATAGALVALGFIALALGADGPVVLIMGTLGIFVALTLAQDQLIRYLTLAGILFAIGMFGMVSSRNAIRVLMSIELMLNAANINMVAFARFVDPQLILGQIFAVFILTVAAAESAVGLAIVLAIYRNMQTVDMEKFSLLKW